MKINRKELLNRLLAIEPGVSKRESIQQSSCVVLRRGRFYSLSREIACSIISGLPNEYEGAIQAEKLIEMLRHLPEEELEVWIPEGSKSLNIKGKGRVVKLTMEEETVLPVDEVERPDSKGWNKLPEDFGEAISLASKCTKKISTKKDVQFLHTCVHIHPQWIEASDNIRLLRYTIPTFVQKPILVRGEIVKEVCDLGVTRGCETESWLHFYSPMGLRVSVLKHPVESYPDLSQFLKLRGRRIALPRGLGDTAETASIINEESIRVTVTEESLLIESISGQGEYTERRRSDYKGIDLTFIVPPKLLGELVQKHTQCEVCEGCLSVNGGKYQYVTSLEMPRE